MKILYIGDIMAEPGMAAVEEVLPELKTREKVDLVIAQAENVTEGKGISKKDFERLKSIGVDFFTGGNWSTFNKDIYEDLENPSSPIVRPANMQEGTPGKDWKLIDTPKGKVLVVSLLGKIVGKDANLPLDNPLKTIDQILNQTKYESILTTVVNLHGDYSSEKRVIGYYLDGRASLVVGDHWHVATADALVLSKGTAHITDVGMCGTLHSSLGVDLEVIISRWRDGIVNRNIIVSNRPLQFNAVIVDIDSSGVATSIRSVNKILQ